MLEELQRRNYSDATTRHYLQVVEEFTRHFGKSPDKLGLEHLRTYQAYLLKQRKLAVGTVACGTAGPRTFWKPEPTCAPFRFCSVMEISRPRPSISISRSVT